MHPQEVPIDLGRTQMNARNRHGRLLQSISLTALAGGLAISTPALAQDAPAAASAAAPAAAGTAAEDPNTIIVTAQFREQRLQDTPLSITAVNAQMIEARGLTSIAEIGQSAPNVTLRPAASTY